MRCCSLISLTNFLRFSFSLLAMVSWSSSCFSFSESECSNRFWIILINAMQTHHVHQKNFIYNFPQYSFTLEILTSKYRKDHEHSISTTSPNERIEIHTYTYMYPSIHAYISMHTHITITGLFTTKNSAHRFPRKFLFFISLQKLRFWKKLQENTQKQHNQRSCCQIPMIFS